jgi:signal transduction histidine kinase
LERAIANLVDNGIRHNEPGGTLEITTRTKNGTVHLRVANGGATIAPEQAATLTEPCRRLARGGGGFGLGLSIVNSVIRAHRGRLDVTAPPSGGLVVEGTLDGAGTARSVALARTPGALTKS